MTMVVQVAVDHDVIIARRAGFPGSPGATRAGAGTTEPRGTVRESARARICRIGHPEGVRRQGQRSCLSRSAWPLPEAGGRQAE